MKTSNYPHPIIAKEGWNFLIISFLASALVQCAFGFKIAWIFWGITLFILQFFRDPPREIPSTATIHSVLSPADGRVISVEKVFDPYLQREALKISVFMNVFNVHSNRSPVNGEVKQVWYNPGKFFNADLDKASLENERNALWIQTPANEQSASQDITCVQIAGLIARRILCYVGEHHLLTKGERYGFIGFGSRVDLYLPTDTVVKVSIGDKVQATSTILAELPISAS